MTFIIFVIFWVFFTIAIVLLGWNKIDGNVRVYVLTALSGLHLLGVFIVYGLLNRLPLL